MVNFRGSNSSDPDGTALSYSWSLGDGADPNSEVDSEDTSTRYDSSGIKTVTLTVTDDDHTACCGEGPTCEDKEDTDTVEVTVVEVADLDLEDPNAATLIEEDDNTKVYVVGVADAGYLVVKATPEPNMLEPDLPDCWSLTGGTKQDDLHTHVDITQPDVITVTCTAGTSSKSVNIYVVQVNLTFPGLAEEDEEDPGKYINVNWNDDDGDGWDPNDKVITASYTGDKDDTNISDPNGDRDFREFSISILPSGIPQGSVTLSYPSNVKVWETNTKIDPNTGLSSETDGSYEPNQLPPTLYLEGISGSDEFRDVELKAAYSAGGSTIHEDIVKVTVFEVDPNGLFGFDSQQEDNDKKFKTVIPKPASSNNVGKISYNDYNGDGDPNDPDPNCFAFHNCMECQGKVKPTGVKTEVEFSFRRYERHRLFWKAINRRRWRGWPPIGQLSWEDDDIDDESDEDLTPSANDNIYQIDAPGYEFKKTTDDGKKQVAQIANFKEWIKVRIDGQDYQCSKIYKWHSKWYIKPKTPGSTLLTRDLWSLQSLGGGWINIPDIPEVP